MSFEVYVQWFRDQQTDGVPEKSLRELFGGALKTEDELGWRLSYGRDMTCDVYLSRREDGAVQGITVHRPIASPELWQALFNLLGIQNGVFYFPGGGLFVRSADADVHLPPDMCEALGHPILVASPADLIHAVRAA